MKWFSIIGLVTGVVFFAMSLTPSLLPRPYLLQGIISGIATVTGYGVGVASLWLWRYLELPEFKHATAKWAATLSIGGALSLAAFFLWRMTEWQDSIRSLMEMEPLETSHRWRVALIAIGVALALHILARIVSWASAVASRRLALVIPRRIAVVGGVALVGFVLITLINGVAAKWALRTADAGFARLDRVIDDGVEKPTDPLASGSAASFIQWETIGRRGKNFIVDGPTQAEISNFLGRDAKHPLRVYVGLNSADTPEKRAALALRELQRIEAFKRKVLIVATPTGTGWLDPSGVDPVEYLHSGDTAIVSSQYSYLPSWMTILVDPDRSRREAYALFQEIYAHWTTLPKASRPRLYLHGLSLGALGSEASTDLISMLGDPIDGAVWSGAPFPSTIWKSLTKTRNPDSPEWLPTVRDSSFVRFSAQQNAFDIPGAEWGPLRIVYLQYASDPMVFFSPDLLFSKPDWLKGERGPDVSPFVRWFPIVTALQVGADLPVATNVPLGYGHNYAPSTYIDGWIAVTEPEGWSALKTAKLKEHFSIR